MILKVYEAFESELRILVIRKRAVLSRLEPVMPVEVALQRMLTAEEVLSFTRGERCVAQAMQILEKPTLELKLISK